MLTAFKLLASAIPRFFIHFYLQAIQKLIETAEQIDNCHQLKYAFIIEAKFPHRGSMDGDSVLTTHHG